MSKKMKLIPELRFSEFVIQEEWEYLNGNEVFEPISNKNHNSDLPILAITQDQGAIPRDMINYHVSVSVKSVENYKIVEVGDFIISLRSFQGGIEYSRFLGLCSPAYIILRKKIDVINDFYRHYFKSFQFIQDLNKNLEGIRDGKMVSYKQFSDILIPNPKKPEQQKIASCISSIDELITAHSEKLETLKDHKKCLMQNLFPQKGRKVPNYRFPGFEKDGEWVETGILDIASMKARIGWQNLRKEEHLDKGDYFLVTGTDFKNNMVDWEHAKFVGYERYIQDENIILKEGDILITKDGSIGKVAYVENMNAKKATLNNGIFRIRVANQYSKFIFYTFLSQRFTIFLQKLSGGSSIVHLYQKDFEKYDLIIPPSKKEQQRIASCLSSLDEIITAQSEKIEQLQQHKKGLMQGLFPNTSEIR